MIDPVAESAAIAGWRAGDRVAGARLLAMHEGLVRTIVSKYAGDRVDLDDLLQIGRLALLQAAAAPAFDPVRATLATYAGTVIARRALAYRRRAMADLTAGDRAYAAVAELCGPNASADVRVAPQSLQRLTQRAARLDAPISGDTDTRLVDMLPSEGRSPDDVLDERLQMSCAVRLIMDLPDRSREILRRHYLSREPETFEVIGADLGIHGERVRQIEEVALSKLRRQASRMRQSYL